VAWHIFSDDFATGMLASATTYGLAIGYANRRHGPPVTDDDARREVLRHLGRRQ
jgi:hypothetical protein